MERVVGGKGSVGSIKNLPQFSHCQRLFLLLIILTHKLCPLHPHTHTRERERSPQLQRKSPRDKKEKRTKMGRDVIMIKRERGARIFRDGEHASVQGKNGRAS